MPISLERFSHPQQARLYLERRSNSRFYQSLAFIHGKRLQISTRSMDRETALKRALDWYEREQNGRGSDAVRELFKNAKQRATRAGIRFELRLADITVPDTCPVLGIPLYREKGKPSDHSPTIDRIDNTQGYVRGNVIVVSYRANRIKADASLVELIKIASFYTGLMANPIFHPRAQPGLDAVPERVAA